MQFGTFFELQLPRPWRDGDERALFSHALEWVEIADRIGVGYAWAQEHHFLEEYSHSTAPEVFLAACAGRTRSIRLGHGVTMMPPAFNHPARIAERIATLDLVSDGRVEWGTGESSSRLELEGFGVNYIEKRAMWAEAVRETAKMLCSEPYAGFHGRFFSMPARNIVPKPIQRPHPPLWVACTNRDTMKLAARLGIGALTFAAVDAGEARYWVDEYYETFKRECTPIGQSVNPNIAMLSPISCHPNADVAMARGLEGQRFFSWALAHYYRFGQHVPGRTSLWEEFRGAKDFPVAGIAGVGTPDQVRAHFLSMEQVGVDQLILLQQAGGYRHEEICETLSIFGKEILPEFRERHELRQRRKAEDLAPYIEAAMKRVVPPAQSEPPVVEAYPVLWEKRGAGRQLGPKRSVEAASLWKLHVGAQRRVPDQQD